MSTHQWPNTQITFFDRTRQSAWLDAVDDTSSQEASEFLFIKTPLFLREFTNKQFCQDSPEMLSFTRCHFFKFLWFYLISGVHTSSSPVRKRAMRIMKTRSRLCAFFFLIQLIHKFAPPGNTTLTPFSCGVFVCVCVCVCVRVCACVYVWCVTVFIYVNMYTHSHMCGSIRTRIQHK